MILTANLVNYRFSELARRPLPSTCVELDGTSDSITNISA